MAGVSELERTLRHLYDEVRKLQNQTGLAVQMSPQMPSGLYVGPQWVIPNLGSVITSGSKGRLRWKGQGTIVGWYIFGSPTGTITFDIQKSTYAAFPTVTSICGGNFPSIAVSSQKGSSTTLTGWTTTLNDGDLIECLVTGTPSGFTEVTLCLDVVR